MPRIVANMLEAKTRLSRLVAKAERGETVLIARDGEPVAQLVALKPQRRPEWGAFRGAIELADDFNAPVPEIERAFEGRNPQSPESSIPAS
jgi:prevent-host-death family protein